MKQVAKFITLDFRTIKPYLTLKNLLLFVFVAFFMSFAANGSISIVGMIMMFAVIYTAYPFAVGDKNGIDILYCSLSIKRHTVVIGRYLSIMLLNVGFGLLALLLSAANALVFQKNLTEPMVTIIGFFLIATVTQAIQLPFYFKESYLKAKVKVYMPMMVLPIIIIVTLWLLNGILPAEELSQIQTWLMERSVLVAVLVFAIWLLIIALSYSKSLKNYMARDF